MISKKESGTRRLIVTVDGPSGAGKGTLCMLIAEKLGLKLLDSGALYRAVALAASNSSVDSEVALVSLASQLDIDFKLKGSRVKVLLEGRDISLEIRREETGMIASKLAVLPGVRQALLGYQRAFATEEGLIADGRDMGTVVFPEAHAKIFLDASIESRAERRLKQLRSRGIDARRSSLLSEIQERDRRDRNRVNSPLIPAQNALFLDSSNMIIDEVLESALRYIRFKLADRVHILW